MAVTWPESLPAPLRAGLKIVPNVDIKARETQSGRKELRRFGKGGGDTITNTMRLWHNHPAHGDQVAAFHLFWAIELNFGINWIDADWLEVLGYSGWYLRVIGYAPRQSVGDIYTDYSLTCCVKPVAAIWEDTTWPPAR